ncbi:hypothetical protein B0H19DRAFT_1073647 [Mycena capillaripes]|nr:hypothetical protein B0H19DRAFT_1073647 [Mycena capillaripes]
MALTLILTLTLALARVGTQIMQRFTLGKSTLRPEVKAVSEADLGSKRPELDYFASGLPPMIDLEFRMTSEIRRPEITVIIMVSKPSEHPLVDCSHREAKNIKIYPGYCYRRWRYQYGDGMKQGE